MNGIRIGRLFGIEVAIHPSWFFILALLTFMLATSFFPLSYQEWGPVATWGAALAAALLLFGSVLAHELGHSLVARSQGIPVRGITLFLLGGVASLERDPDTPGREAWMAIAGPLVSVAIAAGSLGLALVLPGPEQLVAVLFYLGLANAVLVVFNLLPGFPLDGGRVLRALLWWRSRDLYRATKWAAIVGQVFAWAFISLGAFQLVAGGGFGGIWLALIGWMMIQAARATAGQAELDRDLAGVPARRLMTRPAGWLPPYVTVEWATHDRFTDYESRCLPVAGSGADADYDGLVCAADLERSPRDRWGLDRVRDVMVPAEALPSVSPDDDAIAVLRAMRDRSADRAVVVDGQGHLLGFIDRAAVVRYTRYPHHRHDAHTREAA